MKVISNMTHDLPALKDEVDLVAESPTQKSQFRKIPSELRRTRHDPKNTIPCHARILWRLKHDSQFLRSGVQAAFLLLCIWIGIEFYLFVRAGMSPNAPIGISRPPGVEGFLPISALMSLKYWIQTGVINTIHPSGLFIFVAILGISLLMKKAFCSWMCPVGTLSESLWLLGKKVFRRNLQLPHWVDYPLRSLKYLLLGFFAYIIGTMDVGDLRSFIESPYNKMADVKMYLFFAHISSFALWTILILVVLSVVVKNFWCRYLCPYGGLLGVLSLLSPLKVTRNAASCINCDLCTKACPSGIKVHKAHRVWSDECTSCYECVEACPVKNTLVMKTRADARPVPSWVFGTLIMAVFIAVTGLAMLTGHWQNSLSRGEYKARFQELDTPAYEHFGGTAN
jgi:polyferredoxin